MRLKKYHPRFIALLFATAWILAFGCLSLFAREDGEAPSKKSDVIDLPAETVAVEGPVPLAAETFDEVWRIIHDHHFDTNFAGNDWVAVKGKYRPKALAAKSSTEFHKVVQDMLDLLDVSHLAIVPSEVAADISPEETRAGLEPADEEESGTTGLHVRFINGNFVVTKVDRGSSADKAGVRPGWLVRQIEGLEVSELLEKIPEALDGPRRRFLAWRQVSTRLSGPAGTSVKVRFNSGKGREELQLERHLEPGEGISFGSLPTLYANLESRPIQLEDKTIGYIRFNIWMLPTALAFDKAIDQFRSADGIIIDLRGNIGGMVGMIIGMAGHFLDYPAALGTLVMRDNRLNLSANPRFANHEARRVKPFAGPLAILIDEVSASASEVFAGALQELGRARVFGQQTSGQALPAIFDELPNGDVLYHPFGDFVTPKGNRFERRGIVPDEPVDLHRKALLADRDEVMEAALSWLERQDQ